MLSYKGIQEEKNQRFSFFFIPSHNIALSLPKPFYPYTNSIFNNLMRKPHVTLTILKTHQPLEIDITIYPFRWLINRIKSAGTCPDIIPSEDRYYKITRTGLLRARVYRASIFLIVRSPNVYNNANIIICREERKKKASVYTSTARVSSFHSPACHDVVV